MRTHRRAMVAVLALVAATACAPEPPAPPAPAAASSAPSTLPAAPSLYEMKVELENQRGERVAFDVNRGQPVLLAMFYATCPSACPRLIEEVKGLESRLPEATRARTRVLLVSMDPVHDTPETMAKAAATHAVDSLRWTLARAPEDSVRELAAVLGVRYRAQMDGTIDHTSALFLLDPQGVIVEKVEGLGQPTGAIERRLESL